MVRTDCKSESSHVIFYNRFVTLEELKEFIGAADIYITPYLNESQITSGTLAYTFGAGKAVISTPTVRESSGLFVQRGISSDESTAFNWSIFHRRICG